MFCTFSIKNILTDLALYQALGPLVAGFAVEKMGWRWSSWGALWLSAPIMFIMFLSIPETSADNILFRRAQRLRIRTGRTDLKSESEIRQVNMNPWDITFNALVKPWGINALDPGVLFSTFYIALTYGIYYSFFGSFPLVYGDRYGFSLAEQGFAFLAVLCGLLVAVVLLCCYFYFVTRPQAISVDICNFANELGNYRGVPSGLPGARKAVVPHCSSAAAERDG